MQKYQSYREYAAGVSLLRTEHYYSKIAAVRRKRIFVHALLLLLAVGCVFAALHIKQAADDMADSLPAIRDSVDLQPLYALPASETVPHVTYVAPETEYAETGETTETLPADAEAPSPGDSGEQVYSSLVPESDAVSDEWFNDAVFIGDSRIVGLSMHSGLKSTWYAQVGLHISNLDKKAFIPSDGDDITVMDALKKNSDFKKVYVSVGLNELGWSSVSMFGSIYAGAIDNIRAILPDAKIYVINIIPLTASSSAVTYDGNPRVREYNDILRGLCDEKGIFYLDLYSAFADENGNLPDEFSADGVHLTKNGYIKWADYLRTHTGE